mgnify:FL=1
MRVLVLLVFLCVCATAFGEVYKVQDNEQDCELYLASTSIFMENFEESELEKVSSMPALIFRKYNGEIDLKGLWAFTTLVDNVSIKDSEFEEIMTHNFHSVCLSNDKEIVHLEKSRRLFNDLNNLDAQD